MDKPDYPTQKESQGDKIEEHEPDTSTKKNLMEQTCPSCHIREMRVGTDAKETKSYVAISVNIHYIQVFPC